MIYILTLTKICPGEPTGYISDLWEDAWTDRVAAERAFKKMELGPVYFRKELSVIIFKRIIICVDVTELVQRFIRYPISYSESYIK